VEDLWQPSPGRSTDASGAASEGATEESYAHQQNQPRTSLPMAPAPPPTSAMKVSYGSAEWVASPPQRPASNALVQWKVVRCSRFLLGLRLYCSCKFRVGSNSAWSNSCTIQSTNIGPPHEQSHSFDDKMDSVPVQNDSSTYAHVRSHLRRKHPHMQRSAAPPAMSYTEDEAGRPAVQNGSRGDNQHTAGTPTTSYSLSPQRGTEISAPASGLPSSHQTEHGLEEECRVLREQVKALTQGLAMTRNEAHRKDELSRSQAENQRMLLEAVRTQVHARNVTIADLERQASRPFQRGVGAYLLRF